MNTPGYTPSDLTRIELLAHANPDGLHPAEAEWRNTARKLKEHVASLQELVLRYAPELESEEGECCPIKAELMRELR